MGFWFEHKFPYTDLHEMNLDWFLNKFKSLVSDWDDFYKTITSRMDKTESDFTQLYTYVHDYFDNLDLQEEVDKVFNDLIQSGEILQLLRNALNSDLVNESFFTPFAQTLPTESRVFSTGYSAQGFAIGVDNGRPLSCTCFTDGTPAGTTNVIVLTYMDSGVVKGRYTIQSGHCNSACFNGTNFVIACGGGNSSVSELVEISVDGTVLRRINAGTSPWAITYNSGKYYMLDTDDRLVVLNSNFNIQHTYNVDLDHTYTYQGIFSDDLYLYVICGNTRVLTNVNNRNMIKVLYHDGTLYKNIESYFPLEIEECDILDDVCYMSSATQDCSMICTIDLYKNTANGSLGGWEESHGNYITHHMYIDETYNGYFMDGTETKPFTSLNWFLLMVPQNITTLQLHLMSDCPTHPITTTSPLPYTLNVAGNNHKVLRINYNSSNTLIVHNLTIIGETNKSSVYVDCGRFVVDNLIIGESDSSVIVSRALDLRCPYEINGITFNSNTNGSTALIYILGNGYMINVTFNTTVVGNVLFGGSIRVDSTFPLNKFFNSNTYGMTEKIQMTPYFDIDISQIYYPCSLSIVPNSIHVSNAPTGFDDTNINAIICEYVSYNKALITIVSTDGTTTTVYNHTS